MKKINAEELNKNIINNGDIVKQNCKDLKQEILKILFGKEISNSFDFEDNPFQLIKGINNFEDYLKLSQSEKISIDTFLRNINSPSSKYLSWNSRILTIFSNYLEDFMDINKYKIYITPHVRLALPCRIKKITQNIKGMNPVPFHRDTWYGYSEKNINFWLPLFGDENKSFVIFKNFYKRRILTLPNFHNPIHPKPILIGTSTRNTESFNSADDSQMIIFSGAHLHKSITLPPLARPRISVDFRIIPNNFLNNCKYPEKPISINRLLNTQKTITYFSEISIVDKTNSHANNISNKSNILKKNILLSKFRKSSLIQKILIFLKNPRYIVPFLYYK